jgi:hypothetical protein
VVAITPANNATDIDPGTAVKITSSEAMDASTFNSSTVRFYKFDGTGTLSAGLSYESDSHVLTIMPGTTLEPATKYVVALTLQITDATGIPMETFYSATFTTR